MKTLLITLMFITTALAEDVTIPTELTTLKGVTYHNAKLKRAELDGINILHENGAARINADDLPPALRAKFHFDLAGAQVEKAKRGAAANEAAKVMAEKKAKEDAALAQARELAAKKNREFQAGLIARHAEEKAAMDKAAKENPVQGLAGATPTDGTEANLKSLFGIITDQPVEPLEWVIGHKADLNGKIIAVGFRIESSAPEQLNDGSYTSHLSSSEGSGRINLHFPAAARNQVGLLVSKFDGVLQTYYCKISLEDKDWLQPLGVRKVGDGKYAW